MPTPLFSIYRASAGTGKTYTLVKEFLKLLLQNPDTYRHIIAITFTNKAAAEMKDRIIKNLQGISTYPLPPAFASIAQDLQKDLNYTPKKLQEESQNALTKLLHDYSNFSISTIDSFTSKIVKTFAREIGFQPDFEVELDKDFFIRQAIDIIIAQVGKDKDITTVLINFLQKNIAEERSYKIETELSQFMEETWKESGIKQKTALQSLSIADIFSLGKALQQCLKNITQEIKNETEPIYQSIIDNGYILFQATKGITSYLKHYAAANASMEIKEANATVKDTIYNNIWQSKTESASHPIPEDLKSAIITVYNSIQEKVPKVVLYQLILKELYSISLFNEFQRIINDLYAETGKVYIAEFNQRIAKIIQEEPVPFIYERVGTKYDHYFIDEFQDTSDLQWTNISPLIANTIASHYFNMIVGDGKQAIYRWRNGNIELFEDLSELPSATTAQIPCNNVFLKQTKTTRLKTNYRSEKAIIDFNNKLFDFAYDRYLKDLQSPLNQVYEDQSLEGNKSNPGYVHLQFLTKPSKDNIGQEAISINDSFCQEISETIQKMRDQGFEYRDMAILCRKNKSLYLVSDYLTQNNIPISSSESLRINQHPDVHLLCALIRYTANKENIADQLFIVGWVLQHSSHPENLHSQWESVKSMTEKEWNQWLNAHQYFIDFEQILALPLIDAVTQFIIDFRLDVNNLYIRFFMDSILDVVQKNHLSFFDFQSWWEEKGEKLSLSISDTSNAVQILSIHKSKGLEFPVVIFPIMHDTAPRNTDKIWVDLPEEESSSHQLPVALLPLNKILQKTCFSDLLTKENEKKQLDLINLLYVACTRPKQALFVISEEQNDPSKLEGEVTMTKIIQAFFNDSQEFSQDAFFGGYSIGTLPQKTRNDDEIIAKSATTTTTPHLSPWQQKIKLSHHHPVISFFDNDATQYGKLMHALLEKIITKEDIVPIVQRFLQSGLIAQNEKDLFIQQLTKIVQHTDLQPYFSSTAQIFNEKDILFPNSLSTLRPDRIVIIDQQTTIIDYKTGQRHDSHVEQIKKYGAVLKQMGYIVVQGLLVYIHPDQIEIEKISLSE
ncbi:MAG: UvrD-helicase domain-containing protein [Bacteroidales bacterium]|nr:UvrD-helicase domain-containing protein [Bacteroidales bacterium]